MKGKPWLYPPINATGTILHSSLREPPIAEEAVKAAKMMGRFCVWQELPVPGAVRVSYNSVVEPLCSLTGAEDALVVNNIPAAVFLVLNTMVRDEDVVVSGEELLLDGLYPVLLTVLDCSGARFKRVCRDPVLKGCNHVVGDGFAFLLSACVRSSVEGAVEVGEPVGLERARGIPTVKMLCTATLADLAPFGLAKELQVRNFVLNGFDMVVFGGDKLLGGPPVGIVVGKNRYLSLLKREPLIAALHPDKLAIAAIEATLELHLSEEVALRRIPVLRMISTPPSSIKQRVQRMIDELQQTLQGQFEVQMTNEEAMIRERHHGLGALPSFQVAINYAEFSGRQLSELLYKGDPPIVSRVKREMVLLDLRSVPEEEDDSLLGSLLAILQRQEKRETQVLDTVSVLIWVLDKKGAFVFANKACGTFWGMEIESVLGRRIDEVVILETVQTLQEGNDRVFETGEEVGIEVEMGRFDGQGRYLDIALTPVFGAQGKVVGVTFAANDVTKRKNTEKELRYIGMHDALTGLYNRAYFEAEMSRLDSERHYPISVVICDVDGLKLINDALGHEKGDELLKAAADAIRKPFRASDAVAWLGGDEFAVILPATGEHAAGEICERINKAVDEHNRQKREFPLNLSVGFATGKEPSQGIKEICKRADENMYKNKFKRSDAVKKKIFDFLLELMVEKDLIGEAQIVRLQRMALLLGQTVGLPPEEVENLLLLSRVCNIGKISIDDSIISKNGALNNTEWEEIKRHPEIGSRIARYTPETTAVADLISQHHEWWDGSGYPRGLKGKNIH